MSWRKSSSGGKQFPLRLTYRELGDGEADAAADGGGMKYHHPAPAPNGYGYLYLVHSPCPPQKTGVAYPPFFPPSHMAARNRWHQQS